MKSMQFALSGRQVLVTGGTGFIGGRLVERLVLECNADVRVLVRNYARVSRIARFPIELVPGDVTQPDDVERAASGCEVIFHCAYGNSGSDRMRRLVNVEGTRNVLEAALHSGAERIVQISTLLVYGITSNGDLDETAPRRYSGHVYSDSKLDAEKLAFDCVEKHGLPVAILQPTAVYGPFDLGWTIGVLQTLKTGRMILVNGGNGLCNAVYVDDVVSAMLLAAVKEEAVGEAFLISGEQPVTWRDFFDRYAHMLAISGTVSMSAAEAKAYSAKRQKRTSIVKETLSILREEPLVRRRVLQTREANALMKIIRLLLPKQIHQSLKRQIGISERDCPLEAASVGEKPIHPLDPYMVQFYATKTRVRVDKAKRMLGYQPDFDFESGMRLTEEWARWANLLHGSG